jgi:hypothetical protein
VIPGAFGSETTKISAADAHGERNLRVTRANVSLLARLADSVELRDQLIQLL